MLQAGVFYKPKGTLTLEDLKKICTEMKPLRLSPILFNTSEGINAIINPQGEGGIWMNLQDGRIVLNVVIFDESKVHRLVSEFGRQISGFGYRFIEFCGV